MNNPFSNFYIQKHKLIKQVSVFYKMLVTCNYEEEAAKLFIKYLKEHPNENEDELHFNIKKIEREEDHYGNGGGTYRYLNIYKEVEEDDTQFNMRVYEYEKQLYTVFEKHLGELVYNYLDKKLYGLSKDEQDKVKAEMENDLPNLLKRIIESYE